MLKLNFNLLSIDFSRSKNQFFRINPTDDYKIYAYLQKSPINYYIFEYCTSV